MHFPALNNPYVSFFSGVIALSLGLFVFLKNPKAKLNRCYFFVAFLHLWWFSGNAFCMYYFADFKLSLFFWKAAYSLVPFYAAAYFHLALTLINKKNKLLVFLYALGPIEFFYLWLNKSVAVGAYSIENVGLVWNKTSPFTYFLAFGMAKYIIVTSYSAWMLRVFSARETQPGKKRQLKVFSNLFYILTGGLIEWFPGFGIPLHLAWIVLPPYLIVLAYAIVRYRLMEIDTVIHRTILWVLTSGFILIPIGIMAFFSRDWFSALGFLPLTFVLTAIFFILKFLYDKAQPKIDYLFRRKKYDYYEALGLIASHAGLELQMGSMIKKLLGELRQTLYMRNGLLLVKLAQKENYEETDNIGYENYAALGLAEERGRARIEPNSQLGLWLEDNLNVLEKESVELDGSYDSVRDEALGFFNDTATELLVPIILENNLIALLALGRKENLQAYTVKDIRLLETLGRQLGVIFDNVLRHGDLVEKGLLDKVADGIEEGIMLIDKGYRVLWANKNAKALSPKKEIIGDYCYRITHKLNEPCSAKGGHFCPLEVSVQTGKAFTVQHTHFDKDGNKVHVEISTLPLPDRQGKISEYIHIARDVTKKMQMEGSLRDNIVRLEQVKSELQNKIKEMEIFNKIAVDRELKMVELKEKIRELEQKVTRG